ncbi:hypothetical protein CS542_06610 [Pedobacter sp. IW39]|nr:hypothetical protein CS542_06610 [Pedobacter sp. IW39]
MILRNIFCQRITKSSLNSPDYRKSLIIDYSLSNFLGLPDTGCTFQCFKELSFPVKVSLLYLSLLVDLFGFLLEILL